MVKQWILREPIPEEINKELEQYPELVRHLLFYRGVKTKEGAEKFLNPDYEKDLYDSFAILNMDKAVERILQAVKNNEKIVIFGDYDADGVCSCAIFHDFFKKIGFDNFHIHIPDRHLDGYGLTSGAVKEFAEQKAGLIITVDCGITDYNEVEEINKAGIDIIIIDHHLAPEKLPNAFAIIDSKQEKDSYPFKYLCGAGVVFKTIQALIAKGNESASWRIVPGWEKWLLDLAAIATIADMVPLVDENRALAHYGLKVLEKTNRIGFLNLFHRLDISQKNITEDDIAFMIAPRINIASRMDHANTSFELLTTQSSSEANWIAGRLEVLNNDRRFIVDEIINEIDKRISQEKKLPDLIIEGDLSWNTGVLGLTANRLVDNYGRPVFLWSKGGLPAGRQGQKQIKGSCRSDGSINIVELMKELPEGILIESGGHAMAGGFSLEEDKIEKFKKELLKVYKKTAKQKTENSILYIDKEIKLDDINWEGYGLIEQFKPFGIDNARPVFLLSDLEIINVRKFGNGGLHLQLDFENSPPVGGREKISAIGFFIAQQEKFNFSSGQRVDLAASMEKSTYRSTLELRLRIIDVKIRV